MNRARTVEILLFLLIVGAAAALRLPGLDHAPPELNQDEASRGVDAWQIWHTGADRHGQKWPLFLESFGHGDWTAALTTYITVPFVALLGPTTVAMRLPDAMLGTATVAITYFWLRRGRGWIFAACAAAVLATNPWHIALCRTAHESGFAPFFLAMALLGLDRAGILPTDDAEPDVTPRRKLAWAAIAGFMLSLHTWCYPATRLFTPLLCLAILCVVWKRLRAMFAIRGGSAVVASAAIGLLIGAAPIWWTALTHPERLAARAATTMRIYGGGSVAAITADLGRNWLRNLDPRYLFIQADEMSGAVIPGVGQQLPAVAPLLIIGLIACLAGLRRSSMARFLILWGVIYPLPAALCADWNPHPMRTVGGMLFHPVLAAMGFHWLLWCRLPSCIGKAGKDPCTTMPAGRRAVVAVVALAAATNTLYFHRVYFDRFPPTAETLYQTTLIRALEAAEALDPRGPTRFIVTNSTLQPYIHAMWLEALRTGKPVALGFEIGPGPQGFHQVTGWDRYAFAPAHVDGFEKAVDQFQRRIAQWSREQRSILAIVRESELGDRRVVARIVQGDGGDLSQNFVICELTPMAGVGEPGATASRASGPPP